MAKPFKDWINVPDGSSFELKLTTIKGAGVGSASVTDDEGNDKTWLDGQMNPGPVTLTLRSPHFYSVILNVALTGKKSNEIQIDARVVKPDGSQHGTAYRDSVKGPKKTLEVVLFTMETV